MNTSNKPEALLKEEAVCQRLAISRRTLYRLREQGQLPATKIGRSVRWRLSVVQRFMAGLRDEVAKER